MAEVIELKRLDLPTNILSMLHSVEVVAKDLDIPVLTWEFGEATISLKDKHNLLMANPEIKNILASITPQELAGWYQMEIWLATNLTLAGKTKKGKAFLATIICSVGNDNDKGLSINEIDRILSNYGVDITPKKANHENVNRDSLKNERNALQLGLAELPFDEIGIDPGAFSPLLPATSHDIDNLIIDRYLSEDFPMNGVVTYVELPLSTTISVFIPYNYLYKFIKAFASKVGNINKLKILNPLHPDIDNSDNGEIIFTHADRRLQGLRLVEA